MFAGWHGSVAHNDGWADVRFHWTSISEQTPTNTAKRRRTERQRWNKENEIRQNPWLVSRCQMFAPKGRWKGVRMEKSTKELQENWNWTAWFWHSWIAASEEQHWWSRKTIFLSFPDESTTKVKMALSNFSLLPSTGFISFYFSQCPKKTQTQETNPTPRLDLLPGRPGRTVVLMSPTGLRSFSLVFPPVSLKGIRKMQTAISTFYL